MKIVLLVSVRFMANLLKPCVIDSWRPLRKPLPLCGEIYYAKSEDYKMKLPTTSCRQLSKKHEKTIYYLNLFVKYEWFKPKNHLYHIHTI